jgi:ATP-dependent RNA helicase RhlE
MSQSFEQLGASAALAGVLGRRGITSPLAIQDLVIPDALAGKDVVAASPTGSGKTLAFGIPLVQRSTGAGGHPAALVLVPTRELATQVVDELAPLAAVLKLRIEAVYGGAPVPAQVRRAKGAHVLVATPGRLQDLIDRRAVSLAAVRILVLDEADRMLDMGFRPQVDRILSRVPRERQTMLFSATLDGPVADLAREYTIDAVRIRATAGTEPRMGEIEHEFHPVTPENKLANLAEQLRRERGLALVFVRTKHGADKLARKLAREHAVPAAVMHGNMSQNARVRSLSQFESGRVTTLIATDVAARGLDIDDVTHVINFDPPRTHEDYVHRVGRTGRAGRSGTGLTLVLPEQRTEVAQLADRLGHGAAFAASGMRTHGGGGAPQRPGRRRRKSEAAGRR